MPLGYLSDELYHYGVKGMRWGVRKKDLPHTETNPSSPLRKAWLSLKPPSGGGGVTFEEEEIDPEVDGGPALDLEDDAYPLQVKGTHLRASRAYFDSVEAKAFAKFGKKKFRKANWLRAKPIASQITSARVKGRSMVEKLFNIRNGPNKWTSYHLGGRVV